MELLTYSGTLYSVYQFKWNKFSILERDILLPILHKNFQSLLLISIKREHCQNEEQQIHFRNGHCLCERIIRLGPLSINSNGELDIRAQLLIISMCVSFYIRIYVHTHTCKCISTAIFFRSMFFECFSKLFSTTKFRMELTFVQWYYAFQCITNWLLSKAISSLKGISPSMLKFLLAHPISCANKEKRREFVIIA